MSAGGAAALEPAPQRCSYRGPPLPPGSPPPSDVHEHLVYSEPGGFRLYVGDIASALDAQGLAERSVSHVINCCTASVGSSPSEWAPHPQQCTYGFLHSDDHFWSFKGPAAELQALADKQDPSSQWHGVMLLLNECRAARGTALVHCHWCVAWMAGRGRRRICLHPPRNSLTRCAPLPSFCAGASTAPWRRPPSSSRSLAPPRALTPPWP